MAAPAVLAEELQAGAFLCGDLLGEIVAHLPIGALRAAAEVGVEFRRRCAVRLAVLKPRAVRLAWRLPPGLRLRVEHRHFLCAPALLLWACERFPTLAPLRCLIFNPPSGPRWIHDAPLPRFREAVAYILVREAENCPGRAPSLTAASALAKDIAEASRWRRRSPAAQPMYTPAEDYYLSLLRRAKTFGQIELEFQALQSTPAPRLRYAVPRIVVAPVTDMEDSSGEDAAGPRAYSSA
jgi:hypothetical protein